MHFRAFFMRFSIRFTLLSNISYCWQIAAQLADIGDIAGWGVWRPETLQRQGKKTILGDICYLAVKIVPASQLLINVLMLILYGFSLTCDGVEPFFYFGQCLNRWHLYVLIRYFDQSTHNFSNTSTNGHCQKVIGVTQHQIQWTARKIPSKDSKKATKWHTYFLTHLDAILTWRSEHEKQLNSTHISFSQKFQAEVWREHQKGN